jgi:hypothetical protein
MKPILCHLAQRSQHSSGPLATHVSRCKECQEFFQQVSSLESRLVTVPGELDPELCAEIMAGISSKRPANIAPPKWAWISSPAALSTAVALVFLLIGIFAVTHFKKPNQIADIPVEKIEATPTPVPEVSQKMILAYARQQQELFQRDALKLGAHLRGNLILFRSDNQ